MGLEYEQLSLLKEDYIVVQENRMIMAKYDMSLLEQKMFLILVSTIRKDDTIFRETSFKVKELADLMDVSPENLYRDLKKICSSLADKKIEVEKDDGGWLIAPVMKYAEYHKNQGIVSLCLNDKLEPYFLQLEEFFTQYGLYNVLRLGGKYSIRMYQLSKSNLYKKEFTMSLDEIRENLKLTAKSYQQYKFINSKILAPSKEEINDKTDIMIDFDTIKEGRNVKAIKFSVNKKNDTIKQQKKKSVASPKGNFNNFKQREYDFDDLERKLLGWDKQD